MAIANTMSIVFVISLTCYRIAKVHIFFDILIFLCIFASEKNTSYDYVKQYE